MKDRITEAAATVLIRGGLLNWSVDRVAAEAGCAKGLVAYHHGTKTALLAAVALHLLSHRHLERMAALQGRGAEALDRLWAGLVEEVRSGRWSAGAALAAEPAIETPGDSGPGLTALGAGIGRVLEVPPLPADEARLVDAALDGLQAALHAGAPEGSVREAYHRLWLALLPG